MPEKGSEKGGGGTYDVDSYHLAEEVQPQSTQSNTNAESLCLTAESILTKRGWDGVRDENSASWIEVW
jgi:hypothetical protein